MSCAGTPRTFVAQGQRCRSASVQDRDGQGESFSKFAFEKRQSSVEYCICSVDFSRLAYSILFWVNQFLLALSIIVSVIPILVSWFKE